MDALGIGASFIFVAYLIYWVLKNDGADSIKSQTGWLRMRASRTDDEDEDALAASNMTMRRRPIGGHAPGDTEGSDEAPRTAGGGRRRSR
ncbi:MAG: hypothetical protein MI920_05980 [Kiloniellales bacterium]|nr:hypothetical protein [Kiloniellales bacterium]